MTCERDELREFCGGGGSETAPFSLLVDDTKDLISEWLTHDDLSALMTTSKQNLSSFFKANVLHGALEAIIEGNSKQFLKFIQKNPDALVNKSSVKDRAEQRYPDVSPFQLILFLADDCMLQDLMKFNILEKISEASERERQAQMKLMMGGGPDLVKLNFDPLAPLPENPTVQRPFESILSFRRVFTAWVRRDGEFLVADFPLLQNQDGILCYCDAETVKWYYAEKTTRTIIEIELKEPTSDGERREQAEFIDSFKKMEDNSSRRSSMREHEWIKRHLYSGMKPQNGIVYISPDGEHFQDTRFPFHHYFNEVRESYRHNLNGDFGSGYESWLKLSRLLTGWMWGIEFICQRKLPFHRFPSDFLEGRKLNLRSLNLLDGTPLFLHKMGFREGFGTRFAIYKGSGDGCSTSTDCREERLYDMISLCRLVENAKNNLDGYLLTGVDLVPPVTLLGCDKK